MAWNGYRKSGNVYKVRVAEFIPNIIAPKMLSMLTIKIPLSIFTDLQWLKFSHSFSYLITKLVATLLTRSSKETWSNLKETPKET